MSFDDFILAGTTTDLTQEPKARGIADAIEFRIDLIDNPIYNIKQYSGELPIIISSYVNSEEIVEHYTDLLLNILDFTAVEAVDIELDKIQRDEKLLEIINKCDVDIISSYYNFDYTPSQDTLLEIAEEAASVGDIAKIAVMAQNPKDVITLLSTIDGCNKRNIQISGTSLGDLGTHTRIIAPLYGSQIVYAPINANEGIPHSGPFELGELQTLIEDAMYENRETEPHEMLADRLEFQSK